MTSLRVIDNDRDEVTVKENGKELRGWSYKDETERRVKMLCAREFVEGWYQRDQRTRPAPYDNAKPELKHGHSLVFDNGSLNIKQQGYGDNDGNGHFTFNEDIIDWEDDEGANIATVSIHRDDVIFLRDHLNKLFPPTPTQAVTEGE